MGQLHDQHRHPDPWTTTAALRFSTLISLRTGRTITYGRLPGGLVMLIGLWMATLKGLARCIDPSVQQREKLQQMRRHSLHFLHELQRCSGGWVQTGAAFPSATPQLTLMPYWREGRRLQGAPW